VPREEADDRCLERAGDLAGESVIHWLTSRRDPA